MFQRVVAVTRSCRQESGVRDRGLPQRKRAETDQRAQLALFAVGVAGALERTRPLDDVLRSARQPTQGR